MMNQNILKTIGLFFLSVSLFFPVEAIRRRRFRNYKQSDMKFELLSPSFANNSTIPSMYTCDGTDISPPLRWSNVPPGTQSLALIVDDPDARGGHWAHWVIFNLPPTMKELTKGANIAFYGGVEGTTNWKTTGWGGPCPPIKKHRYIFKLYALRTKRLRLSPKASRADLLRAMQGKVIGTATLIGTYQKTRKKERKTGITYQLSQQKG